jgi:hypothetical protein
MKNERSSRQNVRKRGEIAHSSGQIIDILVFYGEEKT